MKKNLLLTVILVLCLSLVLGACQKKANDTTLSVPMVGSNSAASEAGKTYPAEGDHADGMTQEIAAEAQSLYPVKEGNPNFDADMEAWVKQLIGEKHTLDFVLSQKKTAEEWRATFSSPAHEHLKLTNGQLTTLIDWLLERTK